MIVGFGMAVRYASQFVRSFVRSALSNGVPRRVKIITRTRTESSMATTTTSFVLLLPFRDLLTDCWFVDYVISLYTYHSSSSSSHSLQTLLDDPIPSSSISVLQQYKNERILPSTTITARVQCTLLAAIEAAIQFGQISSCEYPTPLALLDSSPPNQVSRISLIFRGCCSQSHWSSSSSYSSSTTSHTTMMMIIIIILWPSSPAPCCILTNNTPAAHSECATKSWGCSTNAQYLFNHNMCIACRSVCLSVCLPLCYSAATTSPHPTNSSAT